MFGRRKKTRFEQVRDEVSGRAHDLASGLGERAGDTLHHAQEVARDTIHQAPEKFEDLKDSASEALHSAGEALHGAASRIAEAAQGAISSLGHRSDALRHKADAIHDKAGALHEQHVAQHVAQAADAGAKVGRRFQDVLHRKREKERSDHAHSSEHAPAVSFESSGDKWLWLGAGILLGAALAILFAPNTGRRTRALLKDKLSRGGSAAGGLGEAVAQRAQDLSNRATGVAHDLASRAKGGEADDADDTTIADRVRSELGRIEKEHGLERINVDSCDGVVTLRGAVADTAVAEALITIAQKVAGVREVKNELLGENSEETFVG